MVYLNREYFIVGTYAIAMSRDTVALNKTEVEGRLTLASPPNVSFVNIFDNMLACGAILPQFYNLWRISHVFRGTI